MSELLPVCSGLVLGALLGKITPAYRRQLGLPIVIILAILATVISGESRISWAFVFMDVPLVSFSAFIAFALLHRRQKLRNS